MSIGATSNQLDVADFTETVDAEFHNVWYSLSISTVSNDTLCIEVEHKADASRWKGEFTSRYIEDITAKTGNYKKFSVFVRMLLSALKHHSESVFVDLLTYQDLELLKSRKGKNQSQLTRTIPPNNKRYFILTYAAEFDRVHYPLPLQYDDNPDPEYLRSIIKQLRSELERARGSTARKPAEGAAEIRRLREENQTLRLEVKQHQQQLLGEDSLGLQEVVGELRVAQRERDLLQARVENAEADLERERGVHRRELRRKGKVMEEAQAEMQKLREQIHELRMKCKELTHELESSNRRYTTDRLRNAYSGSGRGGPRDMRPPSAAGSRASSRGASASNSRAPSPVASTSSGRDAYRSRPGSAPARGRFDPTEYVRQKRERERQMTDRKGRAPTPTRSAASSGRNTPTSSRPNSAPRTPAGFSRHSSSELHEADGLLSRKPYDKVLSDTASLASARPPWGTQQQYSKFPAGSASEQATSPAKALQDVKQKLTDYANRQPSATGALPIDKQYDAAKHSSTPVYEDPTSEIADIDSRLHALQNFLKMAKSNASS